jgi:type II secretory pathway pseudopilin PulG
MALPGFTLVEVVLALGIFTFAVVAIGGLFFAGIDANKGSSDEIQAANLASLLISTRRAITSGTIANFALPPLTNAITTGTGTYVMGVANDGTTTGTPAYNLYYLVTTNTGIGSNVAQVYLLLWWPPASATPASNPGNRYELTTQVAMQ